MDTSLAFGVLFATFITLILVPTGYFILEDVKALARRLLGLPEKDTEGRRGGGRREGYGEEKAALT